MVLPILAGLGGAIASTTSFTSNKVVAFFLMIVFLIADSGISAVINFQGVAGALFSFVLSVLLGVEIVMYSWQVLILLVLISLIGLMRNK